MTGETERMFLHVVVREEGPSGAVVPNLFGTRDQFCEGKIFRGVGWSGDGFEMMEVHYTYCALCFHYYHISSASGHQALESGG